MGNKGNSVWQAIHLSSNVYKTVLVCVKLNLFLRVNISQLSLLDDFAYCVVGEGKVEALLGILYRHNPHLKSLA